jgi:hypothetical protein
MLCSRRKRGTHSSFFQIPILRLHRHILEQSFELVQF